MGYSAGFAMTVAQHEFAAAQRKAEKEFDRIVEEAMTRAEATARGCAYEPYSRTYLCPRPVGYTPLRNRGVMCAGCGAPMTRGAAVCGYCRRLHGT